MIAWCFLGRGRGGESVLGGERGVRRCGSVFGPGADGIATAPEIHGAAVLSVGMLASGVPPSSFWTVPHRGACKYVGEGVSMAGAFRFSSFDRSAVFRKVQARALSFALSASSQQPCLHHSLALLTHPSSVARRHKSASTSIRGDADRCLYTHCGSFGRSCWRWTAAKGREAEETVKSTNISSL